MITRMGYAAWLALALACGTLLAEDIRWAPDVATARKASMEYKVPMLIHFYGDDCLPCKVLEQNVLSRPEVIETLNKFFICVRINASRDRQTAAEYGVHSWPTDVFISPDGKSLDQGVCKPNVGEYLGVLHNIAVMNRDRNAMLAAQQTQNANQVTSQVASYSPTSTSSLHPQNAQVQLPPAGMPQADNPHGPNFYAQGAGTGMQQLPNSLAPNAGVTSGPMLSQNQPHAITTPVQAVGNQVAAASAPHAMNASGMLPPLQFNAQIPPATAGNPTPMAAMAATAPAVPLPQFASQPTSTWNQNTQSAQQSQTFDNPHYAATLNGALSVPNISASNAVAATPSTSVASQPSAVPPMPLIPEPAIPNMVTPSVAIPSHSAVVESASTQSEASIAQPMATQRSAAHFASGENKVPAKPVSFQPRNSAAKEAAQTVATPPNPTAVTSELAPAIQGYCPIALKKQGAWVKGSSSFAVRHRGRIYNLSNKEAMNEFLANPDASSPILSGFDPMLFLNEGKLVEGSIQHGLHEQVSGTILLFTSAESKQAYEKDFDRYSKALNIVLQSAGVQK